MKLQRSYSEGEGGSEYKIGNLRTVFSKIFEKRGPEFVHVGRRGRGAILLTI
jgi:hypothetical protein